MPVFKPRLQCRGLSLFWVMPAGHAIRRLLATSNEKRVFSQGRGVPIPLLAGRRMIGGRREFMMNPSATSTSGRAFTIVELIAAIAILMILMGICFPRYHDYTAKAREDSCRNALEGMRAGIHHFHMQTGSQGSARWPTIQELKNVGMVLQEPIPANPYLTNRNVASIVVPGVWPEGGPPPIESPQTGGWRYDQNTGRVWANSATIPITAPGGAENTW